MLKTNGINVFNPTIENIFCCRCFEFTSDVCKDSDFEDVYCSTCGFIDDDDDDDDDDDLMLQFV